MATELAHRSEIESTLDDIGNALDDGLLPALVFSDPRIFELEIERLFVKTWLYVGHQSEVPRAGDFVVRPMAGESVLLVRGKDERVRVLVNTCRHRGNIVCRLERGNAASFQCPYHGWTYDNTGALVGVPGLESYGDRLDRDQWGLVQAAQVADYNGLIFATFNPDAPSLDASLGDMKWYLDVLTRRSDAGLGVMGAPHRWVIPANWKLPADQFVGDTAHFPFTHVSAFGLGTWPQRDAPPWVANVRLENGHGVWIRGVQPGYSVLDMRGYPESLLESMKRNLLPQQLEVLERAASVGGNIMPNLGFMDLAFAPEPGAASSGYLSFRLWNPIAVDQTEVWSWCLFEKDAPAEFKEAGYLAYLRGFGPSGTFEQDDMVVWSGPTRSAKGPISRGLRQNISMGMSNPRIDDTFKGPGEAFVNDSRFLEANARAFYRAWLGYLAADS